MSAATDDIDERLAMLREVRRQRWNRYRTMYSFQWPAVWSGVALNLLGYWTAALVATTAGLALMVPMWISHRRLRRASARVLGLLDAGLALRLAEVDRQLQLDLEPWRRYIEDDA